MLRKEMGASQVGEFVRQRGGSGQALLLVCVARTAKRLHLLLLITISICFIWHNEEKILKPKTPGCLEHKFCETNGYPVGNGTMEKTKIEHPQEAKWFTYWIRFYFGIGVWIVHTNLLF